MFVSRMTCNRRWFSSHHWLVAVLAFFGVVISLESSKAATLQQLLGGSSLSVLNSRFTDWQLVSLDATSGATVDLSLVNVNPLVADPLNPGIQFAATNQLAIAGINALDIVLTYRVQAINGGNSFTGHTLSMTGVTSGSGGGIATISDEVRSHFGADLGPDVVIADFESNESTFVASSSFAAQSGVLMTTNVFLTGISAPDTVNLTSFTQRFAQTGSPLLAGDYNLNGRVDAADYVVWRNSDGPPEGFNVWRANFGQSLSGSGTSVGLGQTAAVPEPAASFIAWGMLVLASIWRDFRRRA